MSPSKTKNIAIVGAGMAGITCARTLLQAGHQVSLFEQGPTSGGRMATQLSAFGSFDVGTQYFTVRDARFETALKTVPGLCKPWSANSVRVLDAQGRVASDTAPAREAHWVPAPTMSSLLEHWVAPLKAQGRLLLDTGVNRLARDALHPHQWQLATEGSGAAQRVYSGFDAVLLAMPVEPARLLLGTSALTERLTQALGRVQMVPCWTLMLAFPQAMQPGLSSLGAQWNAARSTHHRIAWLARESSKPGRGAVERWTVQASATWSQEHLEDDAARVQAKLHKAFSEITGIRAEPAFIESRRWRFAQTTEPLGRSHLWDAKSGLGVCGDWCLGQRVEDAFISGLELALAVV
jgi:predicted NAD/FAD-dependent oxidoreductase